MRDPWFPITLLLIVVLTSWLGLTGPIFADAEVRGWLETIKQWQTLLGALVALGAAAIAWKNATRTINHGAALETQRRLRKQAALRANLPLYLHATHNYIVWSNSILFSALRQHQAERQKSTSGDLVAELKEDGSLPELPQDAISHLTEFIEFSDAQDPKLFERLLSEIQIHGTRLGHLRRDILNEQHVSPNSIMDSIILGARIFAYASVAFDYARRISESLPSSLSKQDRQNAIKELHRQQQGSPAELEQILARLPIDLR